MAVSKRGNEASRGVQRRGIPANYFQTVVIRSQQNQRTSVAPKREAPSITWTGVSCFVAIQWLLLLTRACAHRIARLPHGRPHEVSGPVVDTPLDDSRPAVAVRRESNGYLEQGVHTRVALRRQGIDTERANP
jgi:hypothetical protein